MREPWYSFPMYLWYTVEGNINWHWYHWKQYGGSSKNWKQYHSMTQQSHMLAFFFKVMEIQILRQHFEFWECQRERKYPENYWRHKTYRGMKNKKKGNKNWPIIRLLYIIITPLLSKLLWQQLWNWIHISYLTTLRAKLGHFQKFKNKVTSQASPLTKLSMATLNSKMMKIEKQKELGSEYMGEFTQSWSGKKKKRIPRYCC